jgi:hypothetical protein
MNPNTSASVPRRIAVEAAADSNERWTRWVATGAEHDRGMHRRTTFLVALIVVSLAIWGTLSLAL